MVKWGMGGLEEGGEGGVDRQLWGAWMCTPGSPATGTRMRLASHV